MQENYIRERCLISPKPSVRWNEVEKALLERGAVQVIHVEARHCIEDWFLCDVDSIISFLRLNKKTKYPERTDKRNFSACTSRRIRFITRDKEQWYDRAFGYRKDCGCGKGSVESSVWGSWGGEKLKLNHDRI